MGRNATAPEEFAIFCQELRSVHTVIDRTPKK
jgi:hypothetical protein